VFQENLRRIGPTKRRENTGALFPKRPFREIYRFMEHVRGLFPAAVGNLYRLCRLRRGGNENPVVARPWEVTYDCRNSRPSRSAAPLRLDQRGSCPAGPMLSRAGSIPGKGQTPRKSRAKRPARHRHDREDPPGGRPNGKCRAAPVGARGTPALPAALPGRRGETLTDPGPVPPSPPVVRGVHCPRCGADRSRVVYTRPKQAAIIRRRECSSCGAKFVTWERIED
jgi:hypothetical protein